jgi:hypothetical protein
VLAGYYLGHIDIIEHHLGLISLLGIAAVLLIALLKKGCDIWTKSHKDQQSQ